MRSELNCVAVVASAAVCAASSGQALSTELVASDLTPVVYVTHAPGDFDRIFVVELFGQITVLDRNTGAKLGVFLEQEVSTNGERGLLGLAFHPDYANNGLFYINYTDLLGDTVVAEFAVSDEDPNVADPASRRQILFVDQPASNHNGGWIGFGPNDGYLYVAMGDGGISTNAQNLNSVLGAILRLDVDGDDYPADDGRNYAIPSDNPFVGGAAEEIWAYGLRNPFRCSFDSATGDFYMGDVGNFAREEVNFQPADSMGGENYGWRCYEASLPFQMTGCADKSTMTFPVHEYPRSMGCSVISGEVYRGCAIPELDGTYFFGDYCSSRAWSFEIVDGAATNLVERTAEFGAATGGGTGLAGFGRDAYGEIYISRLDGEVHRIVPAGGIADKNGNGIADACETSGGCNDADLAEPFGALDIADVVEFLRAFGMGLPTADLAAPFGAYDIADVVEFLRQFGGGCA